MSTITMPTRMESPVRPLAEPERWQAPNFRGLVENPSAATKHAARDGGVGGAVLRGTAWLARKLVTEPYRRWAEHERIIRELSLMSERELADLGLARGDIPYVAAGSLRTDDRDRGAATARLFTAPANENGQPSKAA